MATTVFETNGILYADRDSAERAADDWARRASGGEVQGFSWNPYPVLTPGGSGAVWRGSAMVKGLLVTADIHERSVL